MPVALAFTFLVGCAQKSDVASASAVLADSASRMTVMHTIASDHKMSMEMMQSMMAQQPMDSMMAKGACNMMMKMSHSDPKMAAQMFDMMASDTMMSAMMRSRMAMPTSTDSSHGKSDGPHHP